MKYKIMIEIIEPEQEYKAREIFQQIVEELDVPAVIKAVNNFENIKENIEIEHVPSDPSYLVLFQV